MKLIDLFSRLKIPDDNTRFNAELIEDFQSFWIAKDCKGIPAILLSLAAPIKSRALKNFRLKYLFLQQNVECKIVNNGINSVGLFTIISFTSADNNLQEYFLRISETLIRTLSNKPTQTEIIDKLNQFVKIFSRLNETPTKTIQGLWSELFLISNSKEPNIMLDFWHNNPEEKFDFNSGKEKIEVKSSSTFERLHYFSSEQLNPPKGSHVIIASVFVKQLGTGYSIQDLIDDISEKINDYRLIEKMYNIVSVTLGNSFEQGLLVKYDYGIAKQSLRFYWTFDISKIEKINIPNNVTQVKYRSNLEDIKSIVFTDNMELGSLLNSVSKK